MTVNTFNFSALPCSPVAKYYATRAQQQLLTFFNDWLKTLGTGKCVLEVWEVSPDNPNEQERAHAAELVNHGAFEALIDTGFAPATNPQVDDEPPPSSNPPGTPGTPVIARLAA